ncbi:MAG: hypothetical protein ACK4UJ_08720 [Leptonema sp. (in: bacteria)]
MEREDQKPSLNYILPSKAYEIFFNPSSFVKDEDIIKNHRILSQVYDAIYNLYEAKKQIENYLPTESEIYENLEFRKKNIGDKIPLPSKEEVLKLMLVLATHKPAFLLLLRELNFNEVNKFYFISKVAIPFNNNINIIQNGTSQVIHNTQAVFRSHYTEINTTNQLKQKIQNFNQIEELESLLEYGQIYSIFKRIYFYKQDFINLTPNDLMRINLNNQRIQEILLKPILYQLVQEKLIVSIKRSQYDFSLPDVLLINDLYSIELRYTMLFDLLFHNSIKDIIIKFLSNQEQIILNSHSREEQIIELCNVAIKNKDKLNRGIVLLVTEILSLKEFLEISKKKEQIEQDKQEFKELLKKLSKQNGFYRAKFKGKNYVSERLLNYILQKKVPNLLFATYPLFDKNYPYENYYNEIYLLLNDKNLITATFKQIEDLFRKIQDIYLIRIWEQMFDYHNISEDEKNKLFPAIIRENIKELISKSYLNELSFFKRILVKIIGKTVDSKTLRNLWKQYYNKHKLKVEINKSDFTKDSIEKINKGESKENYEQDFVEDKELYTALLEKISWYLERDKIPTEEMLIFDFSHKRKELENLFKKISLGLKSYQQIITLKVKQHNYFLNKEFIAKNKENLIKKYTDKIQEIRGIKVKDKILSLKVEKENEELYQKILNILKTI